MTATTGAAGTGSRASRTARARATLHRHPVLRTSLAVGLVLVAVWGVKLAQLARSVDDRRDHWSVPQGERGGLVYVALGDSAAQGVGASSPEHGYVGLLADRLRERTGRPVLVVNLSVSGAQVEDVVRDQLPRLAGLSPDVVTVAAGGNDVLRYDRAAFVEQVEQLAGRLPAGALVADVPYFMHGRWQDDADEAAAVVAAAVARHDLRLVRLQQAQHERGWSAMLTDFAADWFHPNDRGHRVWADAFWSVLADELPAPG
jgi:acyl-CoA thioesterase-1